MNIPKAAVATHHQKTDGLSALTSSALRFALLFVVAAAMLPLNLHAQIIQMVAVGEATQFDAWAQAAHLASAANNNFSIKGFCSGGGVPYAAMNDIRAAAILPEAGALWVVWDNAPFPNTRIWAYLSVDSIAAVRGFYASPRAQLQLANCILGPAGMNLVQVPGFPPDVPLAPWVFNALTAPPPTFNAALTSVTNANAVVATNDLLKNPPAPPAAYGYGPAPIGRPVDTIFDPFLQRQPVSFAIAGVDPITKLPVKKAIQKILKKSLLVPFVNATDLAPGGLGNIIGGGFHNAATPCVPPNGLGPALDGIAQTNQLLSAVGPGLGLTVLLDDPLGGSWYFMEHHVMNTCPAGLNSQGAGVNPAVGFPDDPLSLGGPGGIRDTVIGRDMMLAQVGLTPDSAGYITWTCPLAGVNTYLTVGTQNPWIGPWTGAFPPCAGMKPNPNYPLQPTQYVITDNPAAAGVAPLIPVVIAMVPFENWP
jgi:hypothetical protein